MYWVYVGYHAHQCKRAAKDRGLCGKHVKLESEDYVPTTTPPSTLRTAPFTNPASSDAKKR